MCMNEAITNLQADKLLLLSYMNICIILDLTVLCLAQFYQFTV